MNQYQFKGSLSGTYTSYSKVKGIQTPEELLLDYRKRKKNTGPYVDFLNSNQYLCLSLASNILDIRLHRKTKQVFKSEPKVVFVDNVYHHYF